VSDAGPTILLVEDNEMNRDMLSRRLTKRGYRVVLAADGSEGLALARDRAPDLVLMDMSLPVLDGWEATRRLKADPATRGLPVIALTAHAMEGDRQKALAAGADDFDTKPVELPRLLEKIEALLARGRPRATTLERPAEREHLLDLVEFARRQCEAAGAPPAVCDAVRHAVEEACANVIEHGYPPGARGAIRISVALDAQQATITIADDAPAFDPTTVPAPDLSSDWRERRIGGLGWHLIRSMMDEVRHAPGPTGGNVLTLIKRLNGSDANAVH